MSIWTQIAAALDPVKLMEQAGFEPDEWQVDALRSSARRLLLLCSRQSGKSTVAAALAVHTATTKSGALVLLLSPSQRQSGELFRKVTGVLRAAATGIAIKQQSALQLELANGSRIVALPAGEETVRGFSGVALLIIDEAARVPDELYYSVRPMLAVSRGKLVALSTPWGRKGWFYHAWSRSDDWEKIRITAADCPRLNEEILEQERESMGEWWFRQEYLCEFTEAGGEGFIYADWVHACTELDDTVDPQAAVDIGLDVARSAGGDRTVFVAVQDGVVIDIQAGRQPDLMATCGKAVDIITKTRARSIRIDDSGVGGGVTDRLRELQRGSSIRECSIEAFNFGRKAFDAGKYCDVRTEMWWHLGELLNNGKLAIPENAALIEQLTAPMMLQDSSGRLRLESKDAMKRRGIQSPDLADALALACYPSGWICREVWAVAV